MSLTFPRTRRTQKLCLAAGMEGNGQCCLWGWLQLRYLHSWNLLRWLRYNFITLQWKLEGKVFKITNCFIFHFNFLTYISTTRKWNNNDLQKYSPEKNHCIYMICSNIHCQNKKFVARWIIKFNSLVNLFSHWRQL